MVFGWFLVVMVAIGRYLDEKKISKLIFNNRFKYIVVPHFAAAVIVILIYLFFIVYLKKQNDYIFFIKEKISFDTFLTNYWSSLKPLWFKFDSWLFAILNKGKKYISSAIRCPISNNLFFCTANIFFSLIQYCDS